MEITKEFGSNKMKEFTSMNDLRGETIRVIADNMLPYITSNKTSNELGGYLGDIWAIIQSVLKFKNNVTSVGYDEGMELMLQERGDVMLAAVIAKKDLESIEYSQPYFYNWYHLYTKKPKALPSSSSYLDTLDTELWFASISFFLLLTFCLWFSIRIISKQGIEKDVSIPSCLLIVCSGFLNQGYDSKISCLSGRVQIFISLIFGYLLYSAMNAVLVAQLAIFEFELPFKNIEEVSVKRTHSICIRTNSFVYNYFTDVNHTLLPQWRGIVNGAGCLDINNQENVAKVICKDNVIVLESRVVISAVKKQYKLPCELSNEKKKLFMKPNSFILLRNFRHKHLIHMLMKRLHEYGILERLEKMWVSGEITDNNDQVTTSSVTIHHVSGILIMLGSMIIISLLILFLECIQWNYINSKQIYQFIK